MLVNYLKLSWRNLAKNSTYSIIIISGLVLAYSACLAIFLFVKSETSYDRQSPDAERIYRVVHNTLEDDGTSIPDATTPSALAPLLQHDISQVESVVRLRPTWGVKALVKAGGKEFFEPRIVGTDSNMVAFFGLKVIAGDPKLDPKKVVITESIARKYFGQDDALGKTMNIEGVADGFTVVAVVADFPATMHFHYDILVDIWMPPTEEELWTNYNYYTYAKVQPDVDINDVNKQIADVFHKHRPGSKNEFYTQAVTDIHLHSKLKWELEANGDETFVTIFITIGVFIFLIAAVNYINLSIVQVLNRSKEVGIRKVSGAQANELINQFLLEALIVSVVSMIIAVIMIQVVVPFINIVFDQHLTPPFGLSPLYITAFMLVSVAAGLLSGLYPAIYLSAFKPVAVLKGVFKPGQSSLWLRKGLVILQFAISVALITGAILVFMQVDYLRSKELGFNKDQVIIIPNVSEFQNKSALKKTMLDVTGVEAVSASNGILGGQNSATDFLARGINLVTRVNYSMVDEDFPRVMGLEMIDGRAFDPTDVKSATPKVILNEKAVYDLGLNMEEAVGSLISQQGENSLQYEIIGVAKDFHYTSLRTEIMPYAFFLDYSYFNNFAVKVTANDYERLLDQLRGAWVASAAPGPFEYFFLDDQFDSLYRAEENFQLIFLMFTVISIYIACSGLFAIASYFIKKRTKEIGIRKALGASVSQVTWLVSSGFLRMVIIANLVAWPVTYMFMDDWLNGFAYRIEISWVIFGMSSIVALLIAIFTLAGQSLRAAQANPVVSLRNE